MGLLSKLFKSNPKENEGKTVVMTPTIANSNSAKVMELEQFLETEIGKKAFASYFEREDKKILNNTYAVKRGDKYFLVSRHSIHEYAYSNLEIDNGFYLTPIKENGEPDDYISFCVSLNFNATEKDGDMTFYPAYDYIKTRIWTGSGLVSTNNNLFGKFIKVDPHWFECATHKASRKEVLSGNAGKSIFDQVKGPISYYRARDLMESAYYINASRRAEEINDKVRKY